MHGGRRFGLGGEVGKGRGRCGGKQHMRTVPPHLGFVGVGAGVGVDGDGSSSSSVASSSSSPNSFFKDGRKISIGDCALFKPPQDSSPFIGIIRCSSLSKENILTLGVNWLYRPSEVKLTKGILLEAAPNEIFYSFHKDEIPAASVLHPCKVAFLPKGVDLPPGISSFVCRRVYDISNSCLWWLTDQDYINERQEEVDQLLYKTQLEMHATVQPNGHSPKHVNGPTSQLKSSSDFVQNSSSSFPPQAKGKRRERADQVLEPVKCERLSKMDDTDSVHGRSESFLKHEIVKITEKSGLVDIAAVEKFVQLMFPERGEKKIDLASRSLLAGVIASTDKSECLNQFVQLKGLSVLDDWLQEVHKGKVGDGVSSKDNDKAVEEFISVSLRALDKLPVNLHALQTCNIGKSVNHLRSHKNSEIQKKARTLVDTWKKRVEAEMNINDAKSVSNQTVPWSARSRLPDVAQGGNRPTGGSSVAASKSSGGLLMSKSASTKAAPGESACKSASVSPGSVKSVPSQPLTNTNLKDHTRGGVVSSVSDVPTTTSRDEKSTGSSHSLNSSQSCSSDHAKAGGIPGKEDARSSTAGSGKKLAGPSRHKKSVNGFPRSPVSGREAGSGRNSSFHWGSVLEKVSQSGLTSEKVADVPVEVNSHKLIVKISNKGRSPAQNASEGLLDEPSVMNSRASSPLPSDRPDQLDSAVKEKIDPCRGIISSEINAESWQSNDLKDLLMSCDDGDGSHETIIDDERLKASKSLEKVSDASKAAALLSCREFKGGRLPDAPLGSINALVESCVKLSEPIVGDLVMDDVGMNLLASVAAEEMLTSEMTSPASLPLRSMALQSSTGHDQSKSAANDYAQGEVVADTAIPQNIRNSKTSLTSTEEMIPGEQLRRAEALPENVSNVTELAEAGSVVVLLVEKNVGELGEGQKEKSAIGLLNSEDRPLKEMKAAVSLLSGSKAEDDASKMEMTTEGIEAGPASEDKVFKAVSDDFKEGKKWEKSSDELRRDDVDHKKLYNENVDCLKSDVADEADVASLDKHNLAQTNAENSADEKEEREEKKENIALYESKSVGSSCKPLCDPPSEGNDDITDSGTGKLTSTVKVEKEHAASAAEAVYLPSREVSSMDTKVEFDLNEGFSTDDRKYSEPVNPISSARSSIRPLANPLPFPSPLMSTIPIPPAAAKGPFVPPDDFLRTKVELGWRGSAATSAFRPAAPRKVLEMQLLTAVAGQQSDAASSRQSRPLNIDLNVPGEGVAEDAESRDRALDTASLHGVKANRDRTHNLANAPSRVSGGLDLDLNQMDVATDIWSSSANTNSRLDVSLPSVKSSSSVRCNGGEAVSKRDFDLNDGLILDDVSAEPSTSSQPVRGGLLSKQPVSTLKMNNADLGSFSSWFPPGNTFSAVTIPSILPNRGDQPLPVVSAGGQPRMMGPSSGGIPFMHDVYRGSVLSSSPAVSFPSAPFQYFPYGPNFPLPPSSFSTSGTTYVDPSSGGRLCFLPVRSQILGASSPVASQYTRPYVVSLQDGSSSFGNDKKWSRPGLDLNSGPGGSEAEGKQDISALAPRHFSIASSQALAEDQARMYEVSSGVLKRKEPEGGRDSYKQPSWQ